MQTLYENSKSIAFIGTPVRVAHQCCAALLSLTIPNVLNAFLTPNTYGNYTNCIWFWKVMKRSSTFFKRIGSNSSTFQFIWRNVSKYAEKLQKNDLKTRFPHTKIHSSIHLCIDSKPTSNVLSHETKIIPKNATVFQLLAKKCRKVFENEGSLKWLPFSG